MAGRVLKAVQDRLDWVIWAGEVWVVRRWLGIVIFLWVVAVVFSRVWGAVFVMVKEVVLAVTGA